MATLPGDVINAMADAAGVRLMWIEPGDEPGTIAARVVTVGPDHPDYDAALALLADWETSAARAAGNQEEG